MAKIIYEIKKLSRNYRILVEEFEDYSKVTVEFRSNGAKKWATLFIPNYLGGANWYNYIKVPKKVWLERFRNNYERRLENAIYNCKKAIELNWDEYVKTTPIKKHVAFTLTRKGTR